MKNKYGDVLEISKKLISFDTSINPPKNVFPGPDCTDYIHNYAKEHNFEIIDLGECFWDREPNPMQHIYPSVIYKQGKKINRPVILFLGHIDVVPVSADEKWEYNPFEGKIEGERIYGRGSSDMKTAVAAFMAAFEKKEIDKGTVVIAISNDEEVGGMSSMPLIIEKLEENNLLPDYVINGEPSNKAVVVTKRRGAIWAELSFPLKKIKTMGQNKKLVFKSFQGDGSDTLHSAQFILGVDSHAMMTAAKKSWGNLITKLESSSIAGNAVPSTVTMEFLEEGGEGNEELEYYANITRFMNGLASLGSLSWPITDSKYGISICPNIFELDEEGIAKFVIDIRAMFRNNNGPNDAVKLLEDHFSKFVPEVEVRMLSAINTVNVNPEHPLAKLVKKVAEENGLNILFTGEKLGGASDTRFFTDINIPGVELGIIGGNEHGPMEYSLVSSILQLTNIYAKIFNELVN